MLYTIEIDSSDPMNELEKKKSLIHFYMDKKNKVYSYRLVFSSREDLIAFQHSIKDDNRIISVNAHKKLSSAIINRNDILILPIFWRKLHFSC